MCNKAGTRHWEKQTKRSTETCQEGKFEVVTESSSRKQGRARDTDRDEVDRDDTRR